MSHDLPARKDSIRKVAQLLHDVAEPMKVLSSLAWPAKIREEFLASGGERLPRPEYERVDPTPVLEGVKQARGLIRGEGLSESWLRAQADAIEATALMLGAVGTATFHDYSRQLYGVPTQTLHFAPATPLQLAEKIHSSIDELSLKHLVPEPQRDQSSEQVAEFLKVGVARHFGADAPRIEIVDELSANALATGSAVKLRRSAQFTHHDAAQLLNHEAFVHVATAMNGKAQTELPILALGHPGTTKTQEGLAVFSEFVSGNLGLDRLQRLANRTLAVQKVCDGADFIELYRWFLERSPSAEQAFESTRRIFRGGVIEGGAPFTKDGVYVSGLLSVLNFVRGAFAAGRSDVLALLFAGKLDLGALPALAELRALGLCRSARFVPPWAEDPGWVLSYLTLNTFMAGIDLSEVAQQVEASLKECAVVELKLPGLGRAGESASS